MNVKRATNLDSQSMHREPRQQQARTKSSDMEDYTRPEQRLLEEYPHLPRLSYVFWQTLSCPSLSLDSCNSSVHPVQLNALAKNVKLINDLNTVIRWKEDFVHVQSGHGEVPHSEGLVEHGP